MKSRKLPRLIWMNRVNLQGLISKEPLRCKLRCDCTSPRWRDESKDFEVLELGITTTDRVTTFASTHKKLVEKWTDGARAVMRLLRNISWTEKE